METSSHTIKASPQWVEALPKDPTEENAFGWSTLSPESCICLHKSECADATVLPWETLTTMLEAAGYELKFTRKVNGLLKQAVLKRLKKDEVTIPKDIPPHFYNGPNTPGPSLQDVYDVLWELVREKTIVEDMREDGYMGYKLL